MRVKNFLLEQKLKDERIRILTTFIHSNPDARELKRAIAVKMAIEKDLIFLSCISTYLVCNSFRIAIETLWKFLKMHLKLDKFMTKNENGIRIQIYSCLIVYIILQLVDIPEEIGKKILDKLRCLQSFMNEKISYIHWFRQLSFTW